MDTFTTARKAVFAACVLALCGCGKKQEAAATAPSATPAASTSSAPQPPAANLPFEGEIVVSVKGAASKEDLSASIRYKIKGDKVRAVPSSTNVNAIDDVAMHRGYVLDDWTRTYQEIDTKAPVNGGTASAPTITKSGKVEKIATLECEGWTIEWGSDGAHVCAAKGIPYFDLASYPKSGSVEPPWAAALTKERAFPLRVVVHDRDGNETLRAEATSIVRKKLDDAVFQVPRTFKKAKLDLKGSYLP
ncbi:DUF4412 domain-containing protein [Pendulispora brunnea]|uniref:DUF4412 domain-containing protein n=1 Tax=Pendulispora brunnea TaxID=2905690 RepID=A0ABZ2KGK4_9BACT